MVPSITASGMGLLGIAGRLLDRGAATFARAGATSAGGGAPATTGVAAAQGAAPDGSLESLTAAASDLLDGRSSFRMGLALIETGRETEQRLLDVIA